MGHPGPPLSGTGVRWVSCLEPPVCPRVQDDPEAKSQPVVVLVGVLRKCDGRVRVRVRGREKRVCVQLGFSDPFPGCFFLGCLDPFTVCFLQRFLGPFPGCFFFLVYCTKSPKSSSSSLEGRPGDLDGLLLPGLPALPPSPGTPRTQGRSSSKLLAGAT